MDVREILATKRDGGVLTAEQSEAFLRGCVDGSIEDFQATALLMAIYLRGMEPAELRDWTHAMLHSGDTISFEHLDRPTADKHSTGGVGDKASLPLAPAAAACGVAVPMISGRGLGHTGGTLDKLEALPGLRTVLEEEEFCATVAEVGACIAAQTSDLVPADRKLYALRDVTGLVASLPLIASSILSKKLAAGGGALVLDVKFGSGAFLGGIEEGRQLARTMIGLAKEMGVPARALQTAMDRPLGRAVGHALEIQETLECLRGGGPGDLRELVSVLGGEMLAMTEVAEDEFDGQRRIAASLDDGSALERFERMCRRQGATGLEFDSGADPGRTEVEELRADRAGHLGFDDLRELGLALVELGGGRRRLDDRIDPAVGFVFQHEAGDALEAGDTICTIHHRSGRGLEACRERLGRALSLRAPFEPAPLILERHQA